jgi:isoquinoline 1-oxidoreductase subunit beta
MNLNELSRRTFIKVTGTAGTGLIIGFHIPVLEGCADAPYRPPAEGGLAPNAWIRVGPDGWVHVVYDDHEMGQGSSTSFLMMACEEMEADWTKMVWGPVPTDPSSWPRGISTGGSTTIRQGWTFIRTAGAQAREMLRTAAAQRWEVGADECVARNHAIVHDGSRRSLSFGELAEEAGLLPIPEDPPLKVHQDYWLVGHSTPRLDLPDKVVGKTIFGMDLRLPGMRFAALARPPQFQGRLRSFDDAAARAIPGVVDVFEIEGGVAVVATDTWSAFKGGTPWWWIGIRAPTPSRPAKA